MSDWFDTWDMTLDDLSRDEIRERLDNFYRDEEEARGDAEMEHEYGKPRDKETP